MFRYANTIAFFIALTASFDSKLGQKNGFGFAPGFADAFTDSLHGTGSPTFSVSTAGQHQDLHITPFSKAISRKSFFAQSPNQDQAIWPDLS
jgi:hypothetical protein